MIILPENGLGNNNLLRGLVGAWCPSLGPTGLTLRDRSRRGQHMSITGGSSSFWGASGNSTAIRSRKGTESASTQLLNSDLAASVPWTFGCWANVYEYLNLPVFCGFGVQLPVGSDGVGRYWLNYGGVYYLWGGANDWNTGIGLGLNAWRHVIWSYDGTTTRLHINGVLAANTSSYTPSTQATHATVFNKHSSAASSANADISDFGIWSRALTTAEILQLYQLGQNGLGRLLTQRPTRKIFISPSPKTQIRKPNSRASIISKPSPIEPSYKNGVATRDNEPSKPNLFKGLIGAWCPSLGPTGQRLLDMSGRKNHAVLTNMDPPTDWVVNGGQYALDFDGVNDYVDARATLSGAFAVSMWAYRRTAGTDNSRILWGNLTDPDTYAAAISPTTVITQSDNVGTLKTFSGFTFSNNVWFHLVVSRDVANGVRVWKDGIESTSGTQTITGTYTLQGIGRYANATGGNAPYQWDGLISDAVVWSRAITPNEVRELYLLGRGGMFRSRQQSFKPTQEISTTFVKNNNEWCETEKAYIKKNNVWVPTNPSIYTNANWR